jgi:LSD1 subclass zinc finger protein
MPVAVLLNCNECRRPFSASRFGSSVRCAQCRAPMSKLEQLRQLLSHWYYPRRWRADLVQPSVNFLLEKLWTADGQGEKLFAGISPPDVNYDIFRNMVTRTIARGVDEGWMDLSFPSDPLADNPVYKLRFKNPDRFAQEVEKLFPDVNWDEQIQIPMADAAADTGGQPTTPRRQRKKAVKA